MVARRLKINFQIVLTVHGSDVSLGLSPKPPGARAGPPAPPAAVSLRSPARTVGPRRSNHTVFIKTHGSKTNSGNNVSPAGFTVDARGQVRDQRTLVVVDTRR